MNQESKGKFKKIKKPTKPEHRIHVQNPVSEPHKDVHPDDGGIMFSHEWHSTDRRESVMAAATQIMSIVNDRMPEAEVNLLLSTVYNCIVSEYARSERETHGKADARQGVLAEKVLRELHRFVDEHRDIRDRALRGTIFVPKSGIQAGDVYWDGEAPLKVYESKTRMTDEMMRQYREAPEVEESLLKDMKENIEIKVNNNIIKNPSRDVMEHILRCHRCQRPAAKCMCR